MATFPPVFPIRNTPDTKMVDKFPCWQMEWCFPWKCQFSAIQPLTPEKSWENTQNLSKPPQKIHPKKIISKSWKNWNRKRKKKWGNNFFSNIFWTSRIQSAVNSELPYTLGWSSLPPPKKKKTIHKIKGSGFGIPDSQNFLFRNPPGTHLFLASKKFGGSKINHTFFGCVFFLRFPWFFEKWFSWIRRNLQQSKTSPPSQKFPNATLPKKKLRNPLRQHP